MLDTPEDTRQATQDEDLARFPYVNGDLFSQTLPIPEFDSRMRRALLDFTDEQRTAFLEEEPAAERFLRPYVGSREHIQRRSRWILALQDAKPSELAAMPSVVQRVRAVREFRSKSKRKSTLAIAEYPRSYNIEVLPTSSFLVVPEVSSERRDYVPIGWLDPPTIPSNLVRIVEGATKPLFALLTSAMHMAWLRQLLA